MAYLEPTDLTCKNCGQAGELVWVIGVGPLTKPGEGPSYIDAHKPGPWIIKSSGKTTQVFCPTCDDLVTERSP